MALHINPLIKGLIARKERIEGLIQEEVRRPLPCMTTLQGLKKVRLALKDRIKALAGVNADMVMPTPVRINS